MDKNDVLKDIDEFIKEIDEVIAKKEKEIKNKDNELILSNLSEDEYIDWIHKRYKEDGLDISKETIRNHYRTRNKIIKNNGGS